MNLPNVEELNRIQAEWMKLDPFAPEPEKQRVFKLMEQYPKTYVSTSGKMDLGVCMAQGAPLSLPIPIKDALTQCKGHRGRTDVVWSAPNWKPAPTF